MGDPSRLTVPAEILKFLRTEGANPLSEWQAADLCGIFIDVYKRYENPQDSLNITTEHFLYFLSKKILMSLRSNPENTLELIEHAYQVSQVRKTCIKFILYSEGVIDL